MRIIPNWQEKNLRCHFCGETRSVKYMIEGFDGYGEICVPCCNKCALMFNHQTEKGGVQE